MTEIEKRLTFLQIPDTTLCLLTKDQRSACGKKELIGTLMVFEQTPIDRRCPACQSLYEHMAEDELEALRK